MSASKKVIIVVGITLALVIGSWGIVFASAARMVTLSPGKSAYIADDRPDINASWTAVPGVHLSGAKVFLDGKQVTDQVKKSDVGFSLTPKTKLSQGRHTVEARLNYNVLVNREIDSRWTFIVDTQPPPLTIADNAAFIVSPAAAYVLKVKTEPGAHITAVLNGKTLSSVAVDGNGNFSLNLNDLSKKNELKLSAADEVGNLRTMVIPVIKDETSPTVSSLSPADGETVRVQSPKVAVSLIEEDSGLKTMRLSIDSTLAAEKDWSQSREISYLGGLLSDGKHTAKVEAVDYAGHSVIKEWTFTVDSRKIVVNRGEHRLYFYRNGTLLKVYPVAVGMPQYPTPTGHFHITGKEKNPTYYSPKSAWAVNMPKTIPPGPGNPLGTRAIGLTVPDIFIHGTYTSSSVGYSQSHGCIRMYINDVEELFPMVVTGMPVDIIN